MNRWIGKLKTYWYIPVIVILAGLIPLQVFGSGKDDPDNAGDSTTVVSSYGKAEGQIGNIMQTSFMEFTVNAASLADQYQTLTPDAGMKLLVLNITTHVTQANPLVLYDTDYQIQWGSDGELDYSEPVTYRDEWADFTGYKRSVYLDGVDGLFPGEGVLASDETVTYDYVYQVPETASEFQLLFREYFEDESIGDDFCVSFHADNAGVISEHLGTIVPLSGTAVLPEEAPAAEGTPAS